MARKSETQTIHPKLAAVMKPRGSSRGKSRAAVVVEAGPAVEAREDGAWDAANMDTIVAQQAPVDPTKKAADAFAAAHPEGTKALLARLLAQKAAREAGEPEPFPAAAIPQSVLPQIVANIRGDEPEPAAAQPKPRAGKRWAAPTHEPVDAPAPSTAPATAAPVTPAGMLEPHANTVSAGAVEAHTREGWMLAAVEAMRPWFPDDVTVPAVRISFGWPGGRGSKKGVRGQCWYTTDDQVPAIFVSPDQNDPVTVLGIILHELVHASGQKNHNPGGFGKVAGPMGFTKSFTSSENKTDELRARLADLAEQLGPIDHSRVNGALGLYGGGKVERPPVQSTRMVKLSCSDCGYTVRTTRKWIEVGLPFCPVDDVELRPDAGELERLGAA